MKTLICLIAILSIGLCTTWNLQHCYFDEDSVSDWSSQLDDWILIPDNDDPIDQCGNEWIIGGPREGFGRNFCMYTIDPLCLPTHTKVKITFDLWAIDSWDQSTRWGYDDLTFKVDNEEIEVYTKTGADYQNGTQKCGGGWTDIVWEKEYELDHCGDNIDLSFITAFNQRPRDESWGIRNIKIYTNQRCPDGQFWFESWQQCHDCFEGCAICNDWHTCELCDDPSLQTYTCQ